MILKTPDGRAVEVHEVFYGGSPEETEIIKAEYLGSESEHWVDDTMLLELNARYASHLASLWWEKKMAEAEYRMAE